MNGIRNTREIREEESRVVERILVLGRRHGLDPEDADDDGDLDELSEFIDLAARARERAGIDPNASVGLARIYRDRAVPGWGGKTGLVAWARPETTEESLRRYLEALERAWLEHTLRGTKVAGP